MRENKHFLSHHNGIRVVELIPYTTEIKNAPNLSWLDWSPTANRGNLHSVLSCAEETAVSGNKGRWGTNDAPVCVVWIWDKTSSRIFQTACAAEKHEECEQMQVMGARISEWGFRHPGLSQVSFLGRRSDIGKGEVQASGSPSMDIWGGLLCWFR